VRELRPGLWHWEAPHPQWEESKRPYRSFQFVSSYAIDDGDRLLVFDPIAPPREIEELAGRRETAVVLTAPWHERDTQSFVERLGVPVFTPRPDTREDLMQIYGLTAEQTAGWVSPDLAWLLTGDAGSDAQLYAPGEGLPAGVQAFAGQKHNDNVLWIESHRTVVAGDTLIDLGQGLQINPHWLREGVTREQVAEGLRPLLDLPVEHVLATHGGPTDGAALERALS
jgi:glyoxylase-like metal-dependent hydrolase (beta-lactamase superfamily II)